MNFAEDKYKRESQETNEYNYKKGSRCLGRQPDSNIWVLDEELQFNDDGDIITTTESPYYLAEGNDWEQNVVPAGDASVVPNHCTMKPLWKDMDCVPLPNRSISQRAGGQDYQ